ncbi:MAG: adenylate cyclase [Frankiales bacterium]|nr:adenylate cyclase [Frankiales bacterium]
MTDRGAAARARAAARALRSADTRPGAVETVRRLRRALPGDPGYGDPLTTAGRDGGAVVARVAGRLFDDAPRVSREAGLGALQVWQAFLERTGRGRGERDVTLLFTDLVDFSPWALGAGDEQALLLLRAVAAAVEPPLLAGRGQVVKRMGDGLMAVFPGPQLAFDALTESRRRLGDVEVAGHRPRLRAGLHTGRPRAVGGDWLGVDVNVAARMVELAGAGETVVSGTAAAGLDPERVVLKRRRTLRTVKGVPEDLTIHLAAPR